jgi:hypothetical protein
MTRNSTTASTTQRITETAADLFDNWFDPIEVGLRERVREFLELMFEGELDVSTLADCVGFCAATLMPVAEAIRAHAFEAERIHADNTTVPVLAKGKTRIGRLWTYVRDDRPFAGPAASSSRILLLAPTEAARIPTNIWRAVPA